MVSGSVCPLLDSYSLAYTIASLINQLVGRSKEPFWQQAYVNLVRWIIELHRMAPVRWVTLRDVYRCTLDPERIEAKIAEVEALVEPPATVRVRMADVAPHGDELAAWSWRTEGGGVLRMSDDAALREQLAKLGIPFEMDRRGPVHPARPERLDAVKRWYAQDWLTIDANLRSSIIEGLSVFLSVFDLPDVAATFCPPKPAAEAAAAPDEPPAAAADTVAVARPRPPLDRVIDDGKVLCLNMAAGTNPALARAVGVLLKQAWLQTLFRRPAEMQRRPERVFRPAMFLCDEYQTFATVGEDDPAGDEKMFALTRQSRLIPIVATQSISSLRAVLGQSEAWRALLQTLRTRIFLSLADDSSAQIASTLCGQVARMKASYTVSERTQRAGASLLSGSAGGGTGSVGARLRPARQLPGHRHAVRREALARRPALLPEAGLPAGRPFLLARPRGRRPVDGADHRGPEAVPAGPGGRARRRGRFRGDGQRAGGGLRRARRPAGGPRRPGADGRSGGAGRDPDRAPAGRGPGDRPDHRRAAGRRLARGRVQPARGAGDRDHDPPLRRPGPSPSRS